MLLHEAAHQRRRVLDRLTRQPEDHLDDVGEPERQAEGEQQRVERVVALVERSQQRHLGERAEEGDGDDRDRRRDPEVAGQRGHREHRVRAEHVEDAVREVHDVHETVDERQAAREEDEDGPEREPDDGLHQQHIERDVEHVVGGCGGGPRGAAPAPGALPG
jgi:hypothetical protein